MLDEASGVETRPGLVRPRRFRPQFHYELIGCGLNGHSLLGTDVARIRPQDAVVVREPGDGLRWHRCLRCDSWLPMRPPAQPQRDHLPDRDEIELPLRGRPLRDRYVLRLIAVNRLLHFVVLGVLAAAVFLFTADRARLSETFYRVLDAVQGGMGGPNGETEGGVLRYLQSAFEAAPSTLQLIGLALAAYALLEGIEAVGLWYAKRWAEYLTFVATSVFLPLEIYEIAHRVTVTKVVALVINLAVVVYLLFAKRLFGLRGGGRAEELDRARDVGWDALERTTVQPDRPSRPHHDRRPAAARR